MKKKMITLAAAALLAANGTISASQPKVNNEPDSVYLFSYAHTPDEGRSGLKFAWSPDGKQWLPVGGGFAFLKCDYGRWGQEKRMIKPALTRGADGLWHAVWQLNPSGNEYGHAASADLLKWQPQDYVAKNEVTRFATIPVAPQTIELEGKDYSGFTNKVAFAELERMIRFAGYKHYRELQNEERTEQDAVRFAGLKEVSASLTVDAAQTKPISEHLVGIFFEDINYAADGGLYAELLQNRDFEYSKADRGNWHSATAWKLTQQNNPLELTFSQEQPLHANNAHYAVLPAAEGVVLQNEGFDGIPLKRGEKYDFSLFARIPDGGKACKMLVSLKNREGRVVARGSVNLSSKQWKKVKTVLTAQEDVAEAVLTLEPQTATPLHLDMVSLFPQNTFKGRRNGLRKDLAQTLADLKPRFVRFPGGCVAHGDGIDNIYDWKGSIGPLEARKPLRNLWGYHQTRGLGYHEYFLFCEDMGAEPVPVLAAGVPCQNSGTASHHSHNELTTGGQQCGIPMEEMDQYIQDVLDLIEYANGDARKTVWGRKRAEAGHPKPFNLKFIGIGNEDLITDIFKERFTMIYDAVRQKYPEITVIGTVGPFYEGTDYEEGWKFAAEKSIPMVDEHYYNTPGWFINNQHFYDGYDRNKSKVYLGEYAAHLPGRPNNVETALAEALYLTNVERNADVVTMTSYAPLLAKEKHTQWNPDLIYFNNQEVKPTVGYYTQKLYGENSGTEYISSRLQLDNDRDAVKKRVSASMVRDAATGSLILKLVNMLPVSVNTDLSLEGLGLPEGVTQAKCTLLAGRPDDAAARPVEHDLEVSSKFAYTLPAYSFTVIRIQ